MLDVPLYGRVAILELFRPPVSSHRFFSLSKLTMVIDGIPHLFQGETQDHLFILTDRYKFCVLGWDPEPPQLITRYSLPSTFHAHSNKLKLLDVLFAFCFFFRFWDHILVTTCILVHCIFLYVYPKPGKIVACSSLN